MMMMKKKKKKKKVIWASVAEEGLHLLHYHSGGLVHLLFNFEITDDTV